MTIYDLKLYGVCFPRLIGDYRISLSQDMEKVYAKAPKEYRFEVTALKQYGSKQDVLQLQFVDGHTEYITLYEPTMYMDEGEWRATKSKNVAEKFLSVYNELKEFEALEKNTSIFDLTFYGLLEDIGLKMLRAKVALSLVTIEEAITSDCVLFTATILKEYKGKKYVIRGVIEEGKLCYIPLFEANMHYVSEKGCWDYCNESPIPNEILKCYVEYLNR